MSVSPHYALQLAILNKLKGTTDLNAALGSDGRIYDQVPVGAPLPYIVLGDGQEIPNKFDCIDGSELTIDIDIWDKGPSFKLLKQALVPLVVEALDDAELTLEGHGLVELQRFSIDYLRDPDGLKRRAALTFRALTDAD